jgi:predicted alpha-1,2-mannosidase
MRRPWLVPLLLTACTETPAPVAPDAATDAAPDAPAEAAVVVAPVRAEAPLRRYVDPLIGTGGDGFGTGSAFPGPQRPFGMARPGPDTTDAMGAAVNYAHCAGYAHFDTHVSAFSQIHLHGTGIVDEGALGFMPVVGMSPARTRRNGHLAPFRHARETATAGYYRVTFDDTEVTTEVTATDRVALYRVTFPRGADGHLLFDVGHQITDVRVTAGDLAVDDADLSGRVHFEGSYSNRFGGVDLYWVARVSRPLTRVGTWRDGALSTARTQTGASIGASLPIDTSTDGQVTVAIGLSYTDVAHARANLAAEAADLDFDRVRRESEARWEELLGRVQVTARGERSLRMIYTAAYHTLLMPTLVSDTDGSYRGVDRMVRRADGWRYYSDFSLWDTFRSEHPWLSMVYPEYARDFARSLLAMSDAVGFYPRWPLATGETGGMLGDCGALTMADTWLRGVRDFDVERAYAVARRSAFTAAMSRRDGLDTYMTLRYMPLESGGSSASKTMEYAYADGAVANWARGLGHDDDARALTERAGAYRNLWDPAQRFLVGRSRDGAFASLRSYTGWQDFYAEGGAWQYLWYAPHDLAGLATVLGGRDMFLARLDEFFTLSMQARRTPLPDPYYWHGNEPDIHAPWMPSAFGEMGVASRYVDWVRRTRYTDGPDGIPGNDDGGTLSAWLLFAAVGAYPIAGTDTWLLAAPMVTEARIAFANGASLSVVAPRGGTADYQPATARWNTTALARPVLDQATIGRGGTLSFDP